MLRLPRFFSSGSRAVTAVPMEKIAALRQETQAPLKDVKKALETNGGDVAAAKAWLLARGDAVAASKASRQAAEGVLTFALCPSHPAAVVLEVNCETDFSARNAVFQGFANEAVEALAGSISQVPLSSSVRHIPTTATLAGDLHVTAITEDPNKLGNALNQVVLKIGEKVTFAPEAHLISWNSKSTVLGSYLYNSKAEFPRVCTVVSLVTLKCSSPSPSTLTAMQGVASQLARHVAGMKPTLVSAESRPTTAAEPEPASDLLSQPYLFDSSLSVREYLKKELRGIDVTVEGFYRRGAKGQ